MKKVTFYHAGCTVCVDAEKKVTDLVDTKRFELEIVHLGKNKARIQNAKDQGVKSVPALVLGSDVLHINFGANLSDLG